MGLRNLKIRHDENSHLSLFEEGVAKGSQEEKIKKGERRQEKKETVITSASIVNIDAFSDSFTSKVHETEQKLSASSLEFDRKWSDSIAAASSLDYSLPLETP